MKNNNRNQPPTIQQPIINLELIKDKPFNGCLVCGCINFTQVFRFKSITALESPNGMPGIATFPLFQCQDCKHIDGDKIPKKN